MTKIATKGTCNIIESGSMNSGAFLSDLIACPTYKEIIGTDKFIVNGTYEDNQLVKESDITKYTGKTKNYSYIWGEWDLTKKPGQKPSVNNICNVRIKQNFLNAPDTNLKINIILRLSYKNVNSSNYTAVTKTLTVNFTQATGNDKKYAYTQDFAVTFGNSTSTQLSSITIANVSIEPTSGTSKYKYFTNIKNITQNYFVNVFSVTSSGFFIDSYDDDTTNKILTNTCKISPYFDAPTGNNINDIVVNIDNYNYSGGNSIDVTYNTSLNNIIYKFNAYDKYGERGYKLPYLYAKISFKHNPTSNMSYVYALWEPNSTNTGIELSSLILEE